MPWEYLIALANETQTDMWINIPEGATNDYITALAGIFKNGGTVNGVTYAGLNSNLKIYVEYSNEVWGGILGNEYYQEAAVQNTADNQPLSTFPSNLDVYNNVDGTTTTAIYTAAGRRYLERTNDIGQIFQSVLGADPTHQRIRPVLGWQEDNTSFWPEALQWYEHFFGPASAAFYGMGDANYLNVGDYSSVDSIISSMQSELSSYSIPDTTDFTTLATFFGLANVSYEGGPAIGGDGTTTAGQNALAASRDPAMEQLVLQEYEDFYAAGGTLGMYFDGPFDGWSPEDEWAAAELSQVGDPTASAKYRGTVDVADAAPVAVTAGIAVPASGPTSFSATTDTLGASFSSPSSGQQNYWLLNVASSGTYDLTMTTGASGGQAPGQVEVFVDDRQVGGTISVSGSATTVDLGNLPLSAGLNTLSLYVVHGSNDTSQSNSAYYQFNPMSFALMSTSSSLVGDSGFEAIPVGAGNYAYDPTGSAWTFSGTPGNGSGISGNGSGFTSGNPSAPQGSQVAFLQGSCSITQSVTGWAAGSYTLSFDAAQRGNPGGVQNFEVLIDGNAVGAFEPTTTSYQVYTTTTFTVSAGAHTIEFLGMNSAGGDDTDFLDDVTVAVASAPPPASGIGDPEFGAIPVGAGNYAYDPTGSAWTFSGAPGNGSGVSGNDSAFTSGNPNAPVGTQVAFLQGDGTITQSVSGWAAGSYTLSFDAADRGNHGGVQNFEVLIDGNIVGAFEPTTTSYQVYTTTTFTVSAGTHVIELLGINSAGGDDTDFLDDVTVAVASAPPPTSGIGDPEFEEIPVGAGNYAYDPTGSAWTFSGVSGNGSGVSGNDSAFTSGNPNAPVGTQVAFLQGDGTITQSVTGWAAGSYTLSLDAAERGNHGGVQNFEVLIDG